MKVDAATVPTIFHQNKSGTKIDNTILIVKTISKMKHLSLLLIGLLLTVGCTSIRVFSDYDKTVNFNAYTTYAFFKPGIEEVEISDLDKRRILKAIEAQMDGKKLTLSKTPDLLINIAVKATDRVIVNSNNGWGYWGWSPWFFGNNNNTITTQTRGELFIDFIDAKTKMLVWQGKGYGGISEYDTKRDEKIQTFVSEILKNYPPTAMEN